MSGLSNYTYATLKQAILDYTEVDSNVFTTTILDGFIMAAQNRINLDLPMDSDRAQDQGQFATDFNSITMPTKALFVRGIKVFNSTANTTGAGQWLEKHEIVTVLNVRGNHDSDPALWLNEAMKMYFENEPRVIIPDNYSKFTHLEFGNSLIVLHHGDKINPQRIYESVTRRLSVEWGRSKYRYGWLGHLHHKEAKEIGGMMFEQFNVFEVLMLGILALALAHPGQ